MSPAEISGTVVNATNILCVVFAATAAASMIIARRDGAGPLTLILVAAAALAWGAVHAFYPPLVTWRSEFPLGQPMLIGGLIVALTLAAGTPTGVAYFRAAALGPLIALFAWRIVFGGALLVLGLSGALPEGFFWPAALGDIFVGLWALSMLPRFSSISRWELLVWNVVGLLDLLNVLRMGLLELRPFFVANPDMTPLSLLPLFGVPFFIALHLQLFRTIWRHGSV
jgi:hypothetical protein